MDVKKSLPQKRFEQEVYMQTPKQPHPSNKVGCLFRALYELKWACLLGSRLSNFMIFVICIESVIVTHCLRSMCQDATQRNPLIIQAFDYLSINQT